MIETLPSQTGAFTHDFKDISGFGKTIPILVTLPTFWDRTLWHEVSGILICACCILLLDRTFLGKYRVDK